MNKFRRYFNIKESVLSLSALRKLTNLLFTSTLWNRVFHISNLSWENLDPEHLWNLARYTELANDQSRIWAGHYTLMLSQLFGIYISAKNFVNFCISWSVSRNIFGLLPFNRFWILSMGYYCFNLRTTLFLCSAIFFFETVLLAIQYWIESFKNPKCN